MDGSCRQNYFGPVVLWWVWDGSFSLALFQVARFSVSDDAAVAHFSTVEWAFRGESLALHIVILSHTDIIP